MASNSAMAFSNGCRYVVSNQTPRALDITNANGQQLNIAPLGQRIMAAELLRPFAHELGSARMERLVHVRKFVEPDQHPVWSTTIAAAGGLAVLVGFALGVLEFGTMLRTEVIAFVIGGALFIWYIAHKGGNRDRKRQEAERDADAVAGDIDYGSGAAFTKGNETVRLTRQYGTLVLVVLVGAIGPAIAIAMATDLKTFVVFEGGLAVKPGFESVFISRVIQVIYVAILTLFPALMYFMYDRQRVGTIRGQWIRSIFRADNRAETLSDVNARYGAQLLEASYYSTDATKLLGGRRSPIFVATILFALGFTILVSRTESFDFELDAKAAAGATVAAQAADRSADAASDAAAARDANDPVAERVAAAEASEAATDAEEASEDVQAVVDAQTERETGEAVTDPAAGDAGQEESSPIASSADEATAAAAEAAAAAEQAAGDQQDVQSTAFFQLLNPRPTAAGMAFLGAYFFAVFLVLRGTLRGDLRPKVYNQVTARLVTVVVIAYLINVLFSGVAQNRVIWSVAFLAGIVPTAVLRWIGEQAPGNLGTLFGAAFSQQRQLTRLDGVDIYERERLGAEGINDIEGLAHSDLIATMIQTRIPMERLIDWADQAVLILHIEGPEHQPATDDRLTALRGLGIRTASDLVRATTSETRHLRAAVKTALQMDDKQLKGLVELLEDEPVMRNIRCWHTSELGHPERPVPRLLLPRAPSTPPVAVSHNSERTPLSFA